MPACYASLARGDVAKRRTMCGYGRAAINIAPPTLKEPMATIPTAPRPRPHHGRLVWRSRWYDDGGKRRDKLFGPVDEVPKREVVQRYRAWLTSWTNHDRVRNPQATQHRYSIPELARNYLEHARATFRKHDRPTTTVSNVTTAMQLLLDG